MSENRPVVENHLRCDFPFFCPEGSPRPIACDLGFGPVAFDGLRFDKDRACSICEAGSFRSNFTQVECLPCVPGYFCPEGTSDLSDNICTEGQGSMDRESVTGPSQESIYFIGLTLGPTESCPRIPYKVMNAHLVVFQHLFHPLKMNALKIPMVTRVAPITIQKKSVLIETDPFHVFQGHFRMALETINVFNVLLGRITMM